MVPELKVQSVLRRMGRLPDAIVDRAVGSEIALREGARVLLLPSVAEVGGKLRLSIEVVDPTNQVTVFADSEDGRGIESALASLDDLNGRLRERLGESLGDIAANGKPLAQISTPSLEALRLYTLANEAAASTYDFDESLRLLNLALREDPQFAMAYSSRARLRLADSDYVRAKQDYGLASRLRGRLSSREAMFLDAGIAEFGSVQSRLDIWKVIARVYPDTYRAYFQLAYNRAFYFQEYQQALAELKPALTQQNARLPGALHMSGLLYLGMENYTDASRAFERAESLGSRDPIRYHADTFAVLRQYGRARELLKTQKKTGFAGADLDARLPEVTYPIDQGEWQSAIEAAQELATASPEAAPLQSRTYRATWLGLRSYSGDQGLRSEFQALASSELERALRPNEPDAVSSSFAALFAGAMAARLGDRSTGESVLSALGSRVPAMGYPALDDMVAVLKAELAMSNGEHAKAIEELRPRLSGRELNWIHATLLRAFLKSGSTADARREAEWLAAHRGRAYVEWNSQYLLQPMNVAESNLALLATAEIARSSGDVALAEKQLNAFLAAWKRPPAFAAGRVASIQDWINQRKHQTDQRSRR